MTYPENELSTAEDSGNLIDEPETLMTELPEVASEADATPKDFHEFQSFNLTDEEIGQHIAADVPEVDISDMPEGGQ